MDYFQAQLLTGLALQYENQNMGWWKSSNNDSNTNSSNANIPKYSQSQSQTPQSSFHSYFKSYSSSTSCKDDPQDHNFIICTEKVHDGNQAYQNIKRVPKNQYNPFGGFSNFSSRIGGFFNQGNQASEYNDQMFIRQFKQQNLDINKAFGDIQRQMQGLMGGFLLPFAFSAFNNSMFPTNFPSNSPNNFPVNFPTSFPPMNPFNYPDQSKNGNNNYNTNFNSQNNSRQNNQNNWFSPHNNSNRTFSHKQKDTGVRDL